MTPREYIVTACSFDDLDSLYEDLESSGVGRFNTLPDRTVECAVRRPISRNTHYWLTDEEAEQVKQDPRVLDVSLTPKELGIVIKPLWSRSANFTKTSTPNALDKNWGPYRTLLGSKIAGWGSDGVQTQSDIINYNLSGKNVDIVIVDGIIKANHAEFKNNIDGTGHSRVNQFNWFSLNSTAIGTAPGVYDYTDVTGEGRHGTHVAGIAGGNTNSLAIDSNIYNLSAFGDGGSGGSVAFENFYDYIRAWHNSKSVNPYTGVKNPTVVNNSYGASQTISLTNFNNGNGTVTHRGTVYSGPWTATGNGTKTWRELGFDSDALSIIPPYGPTDLGIEVQIREEALTAIRADLADAIADGIHIAFAAGNDSRRLDIPGGLDFDNKVTWYSFYQFYINRSAFFGNLAGNLQYIFNVGNIEKFVNEPVSSSSSKGPGVNIWAPGSGIVSAAGGVYGYTIDPRGYGGDKIESLSGTSMASPQVVSFIATLLELNPTFTPADVYNYVRSVAKTGLIDTSLATTDSYDDVFSLQGSTNLSLYAPNPTFNISANVGSLTTGSTVTYTITTNDVPVGSVVYLTEVGAPEAVAGDFVDSTTQLPITITSNSVSVNRTLVNSFSGSKTSTLQLRTGGYNGAIQSTSTINLIGNPRTGSTFPKLNYRARPATGQVWPRPRIFKSVN